MRIVPCPTGDEAPREQAWLAELEAALDGSATGPSADSWRELCEDVRALPTAMAPEFERELTDKLEGLRVARRPTRRRPSLLRGIASHRPLVAAFSSGFAVLVAVVLIIAPWNGGGGAVPLDAVHRSAASSAPGTKADSVPAPTAAPSVAGAASTFSPPTASGRLQQRAATIGLATSSSELQSVANGVARIAVGAGGFVQNSNVQAQEGAGSAELDLSIPSAKLNAVLGSLGALASLRSESQSLQDITDSYEAARRGLADANAERQGLLKALAAASTQGQIDSLRERLAGVGQTIAHEHGALQAISRRASNSEVQVTVSGGKQPAGKDSTLHRGLHDAGRVLLVTLTVLLIAAAVLVPLGLLTALLMLGRSSLRRYRRERLLDGR